MRRILVAAVVLVRAGCAPSPVREPAKAPAEAPKDFPESHYRELLAAGKPVYRVDPKESVVVIEVRRAGKFANLGHDHVVASRNLRGWIARGTLALKGAKQPVDVPFAWTPSGDGATMEGELAVKRGAFGIGAGEWASSDTIGADVKVRFKVRMAKGG